ncbi:polysaccharide deacetylase family protein [Candidatus Pyrohabitans sp.]
MRLAALFAILLLITVAMVKYEEKSEVVVVLTFDYEDLTDDNGTRNIPQVLRLLDKHNAPATFFVLGKTAKMHPGTVRMIAAKNHSIGMHTYFHNLPIFSPENAGVVGEIYGVDAETEWRRSFKTKEAFFEDIERTKRELEGITGITPQLFRCPSLVVNWAPDDAYFQALQEAGVVIDSSVYQGNSPWYSVGSVVEIPITGGHEVFSDTENFLNAVERQSKHKLPLVILIHPAKLDDIDLLLIDEALTIAEARHNVRYAKIEEIPGLFRK